jgi:hypothetical protein
MGKRGWGRPGYPSTVLERFVQLRIQRRFRTAELSITKTPPFSAAPFEAENFKIAVSQNKSFEPRVVSRLLFVEFGALSPPDRAHQPFPFIQALAKAKFAGSIET